MDRIRKVIYIIVGTLTAILLTFTLMKKIGLCAEAGTQTVTSVIPLYTSQTEELHIGTAFPITQSQIDYILQDNANGISLTGIMGLYVNDWTDEYIRVGTIMYYSEGYSWTYDEENGIISYTTSRPSNPATNYFYRCYPDGTVTYQSYSQQGFGDIYIANAYTNYGATQDLQLKINQNVAYYPIWINPQFMTDGIVTDSTTGQVLIAPYSAQPSGHTKGGVIAEITENDDIVGQDLPQIDTTAPSTDTNANWFQKILNALGGIGKRIQNDTLTTGWYLNEIKEGNRNFFLDITALLGTALPSITEKLDTIIGYNREQAQENRDDWLEGYQTSAIKSIADTGHSYKETLSQIGQRNTNRLVFGVWRLEYNGNDLHLIGNYTMPQIFSGQTVQQDISFAWYNQVRNYVVNVFKVILYVGFGWYILTQVPNMIKGASGPTRKIGDEAK